MSYSSSADGDERIDADLVVDAMGRGSSVSDWLVEAGWPETPVMTLDAKVTYVSRWYDLPTPEPRADSWWWQHMVFMPTQEKGEHPDEHEYLVNFFPMEGNRSIACMGSWGLDMPRTVDDFLASAERLRTPTFAEAMAASEPSSEVHLTRSTGQRVAALRPAAHPPLGIVFIGDAICAFNPFYGQGMSSAALLGAAAARTACDPRPRWTSAFFTRLPRRAAQGVQGAVGAWRWRATAATSAPPAPRSRRRGSAGSWRR